MNLINLMKNINMFFFILKECCYKMHGSINNLGALERSLPSAGTLLQYNPFFEQRKHSTEDFKPKEACCIKIKHCKWFYEVRPIPWCYLRSPFNPGILNNRNKLHNFWQYFFSIMCINDNPLLTENFIYKFYKIAMMTHQYIK